MSLYRHKSVVVDAVKIIYAEMLENGPEHSPFSDLPDWVVAAVRNGTLALSTRGARDYAVVDVRMKDGHTLEATPGDYLIRSPSGDMFPCPTQAFMQMYERYQSPDGG